jgi:DNA-directed RNA polymerase alpha subunit
MDRYAPDILHVKRYIQQFDVKRCKLLYSWLATHITELEIDKKMYKVSIQQLHFSARAANVLRASGIFTIGQLLAKSVDWDDIRVLKGAGEKVVKEIQEKVDAIRSGKFK